MKTLLFLVVLQLPLVAAAPDDGSVLPFPPTPLSDSVATPRLQDAKMKWPAQPQRLPKDAPNILIVLLDDGWDNYRERVHKRQLEMGIIPPGTKLTPGDETMTAWSDIPENQRAFQRRGMELFAGFVEHTDVQVGRIVDGLTGR